MGENLQGNVAHEDTVQIECPRCAGVGWFPCWSHIYNGLCFKCDGRKTIRVPKATVERWEREAKKALARMSKAFGKRVKLTDGGQLSDAWIRRMPGLQDGFVLATVWDTIQESCFRVIDGQVVMLDAHEMHDPCTLPGLLQAAFERAAQPSEPAQQAA